MSRPLAAGGLTLGLLAVALAGCPPRASVGFSVPPPDGTSVTCPVTGARCEKGPDTPSAVVDERSYYFCAEAALRRFRASPERYQDHP